MPADRLSHTFSALADPTRRAILARLIQGETSVTELAQPFNMSLPAVSKHLKVLEKAGLVSRGREAQWRPCRLDAGPLKDITDWLEPYRKLWEARFDRLEAYLQKIQAEAADAEAAKKNPEAPDGQQD
ncbi:ArsR/SmtB family transcription factor [Arenimonas daejeonensis]|uniref:ArsR/SmtB family transcription factor n=1 Tax=Arenimonas daejeonensis TaxID=370777 RepID=UPI0011BE2606|nr:metalloregulator ArsR/SmtB family transcription factor [Arenimonas daejeonensis]